MTIHPMKLKYNKKLFHRAVANDSGLNIRLYRMADPIHVGAIIITDELKDSYRGYRIRLTHEEFKQGALQALKAEDIQ